MSTTIWADKPLIQQWIFEVCKDNNVSELVSKIKWRFNGRFRSRLGDANYRTMIIRFSAPLWGKATLEQKQQTTKHEIAHLISWYKYGPKIKSHGIEWKEIMIKAGQTPDVTHKIQTFKKTIDVICVGCITIHKMGLIRAHKLKSGQAKYNCKECGSSVEFMK